MLDNLWGEVIATPGEQQPFRVIVGIDGRTVLELDAPSREVGTLISMR